MRVLYLYCHPLPESFHAAIRARALDGLAAAKHEVDLLDLYAENFDPVMSQAARRDYHDTSRNQAGLESYVERLRAAQALVVQFPVWSFGMPAMLKGYFDRMMMPGVAFDLSDPAHAKPLLGNLRRIAGITTYGRPWTRAFAVGDPPRKMVKRYLPWFANRQARVDYYALYHMNVASEAKRAAFIEKIQGAMARFSSEVQQQCVSDFGTSSTPTTSSALIPETTIAVLPMAATEQHGPHLPVATDIAIAEGMIAETIRQLPDDLAVLFLPIQAIGKSNEHLRSPGTITLTAETAIRAWTEIGEAVNRAGLRKLVLVNSHGGNVDVISIVARDLRVRLQMLVVACHWGRFGQPKGLYTDQEAAVGIHAGDMETSLMLHFRPDLVRMDKADNFAPSTIRISNEFDLLRPTGHTAFGWIAQDLHPSGAAGDASRATAEKGKATAEYRATQFIKLLNDVRRFSMDRLA